MKRRFTLFLLSALGFTTACENEDKGTVCMYGTPLIDFELQGTVTDQKGSPIPGIEVTTDDPGNRTATASDGSYRLSGQTIPNRVLLRFTDVDGAENGGEFASQELPVEFTEEDRTGETSGSWNRGSFARSGVDASLPAKTEEEQ